MVNKVEQIAKRVTLHFDLSGFGLNGVNFCLELCRFERALLTVDRALRLFELHVIVTSVNVGFAFQSLVHLFLLLLQLRLLLLDLLL